MAIASIPVDLFNPGQVFACLGFAEAALILMPGETLGAFRTQGAETRFELQAASATNPFELVLEFLANATVHAEAPNTPEELATEKWGVPTIQTLENTGFPFPAPASPATLPAVLTSKSAPFKGKRLVFDHWGDATIRDNVKFWAGAGGFPGAALLRDALDLARPFFKTAAADPFAVGAAQSSSFRFDWRRDYVPLGVGFSLNNHSKLSPVGYPIVEILAALGMAHARPLRPKRSDKLHYRYAVPTDTPLPVSLLRAALGTAALPFPTRIFQIALDWPGQENQARCITDVTEETSK